MNDVQLVKNSNGEGVFLIMDGREKVGEMVVSVDDKNITVYHTEVATSHEGKGLAKKLLDEMVAYARSQKLSVIPLCPYVHLQFKRHPDQYADIWNRSQEQEDPS
ncbi:N-acetyltransferase [Terrimonas sp. NA20]|uniref:N-acetyltransferase n=1 Tax=Terrimonas ginsenosidimutans TaxID=2908004 RepID=A0ABS9KR23_9BACT|nr:GNAT family N-acetyltransferase [Terrimonas ginsenosidimutans]MCG2614787.1 N-acetyltransferase [Terrimonas ginsenosidimutans]